MKSIISLVVLTFLCSWPAGAGSPDGIAAPEDAALALHHRIFTLDTHCDTPFLLLAPGWNIAQRHDSSSRGGGRQDFPRMEKGGLDASFFAVFVPQGPRTAAGNRQARQEAERVLAALEAMFRDHPDVCERALTPEDGLRIAATGKRAIYIGLENGYPVHRDLGALDRYFDRGVRYVTLSHTADNDICDSSTDEDDPRDRGLSRFGRQVVRRMNDLGLMIDVSHISDRSLSDVLARSRAPVLASHSCARALCDHPRNLSDDQLRAIAGKGGVVQLCILSEYVKKTPENPERSKAFGRLREKVAARWGSWNRITDAAEREALSREWEEIDLAYPQPLATVKDAVDHIDHIVKVAGIDSVGIGTDFDGGGGLADCRDVTELPAITRELVARGYSEQDIAKIWGGNALRVFSRVLAVARAGKP